jgi:hypothetical protein
MSPEHVHRAVATRVVRCVDGDEKCSMAQRVFVLVFHSHFIVPNAELLGEPNNPPCEPSVSCGEMQRVCRGVTCNELDFFVDETAPAQPNQYAANAFASVEYAEDVFPWIR